MHKKYQKQIISQLATPISINYQANITSKNYLFIAKKDNIKY